MEDNPIHKLQQKDIDYLKKEFHELKETVTAGFSLIHAKLEVLAEHYVRRDELDREFSPRDEKLNNLLDNQKWVVRSIIGIVITALMALIITTKL